MVEASEEGFSLDGTLQASLDHVVTVLQIYLIITIRFGIADQHLVTAGILILA